MKLPVWGTILTFIGVVVLCALGLWQLQRLDWKRGILEAIEAERNSEASLPALTLADFENGPVYKRGQIEGRFIEGKNFLIGPRTHEGKPGYHIIAPFALDGSGVVLVNRGWVGLDYNPADIDWPAHSTITGVLRQPDGGNMFTPPNQPEKDIWYVIDRSEIAWAKDLHSLSPLMLYEESDDIIPLTESLHSLPDNNHLQYALFWFAMAGAMVVVYGFRFLRHHNNSK